MTSIWFFKVDRVAGDDLSGVVEALPRRDNEPEKVQVLWHCCCVVGEDSVLSKNVAGRSGSG